MSGRSGDRLPPCCLFRSMGHLGKLWRVWLLARNACLKKALGTFLHAGNQKVFSGHKATAVSESGSSMTKSLKFPNCKKHDYHWQPGSGILMFFTLRNFDLEPRLGVLESEAVTFTWDFNVLSLKMTCDPSPVTGGGGNMVETWWKPWKHWSLRNLASASAEDAGLPLWGKKNHRK